MLRCLFLLLCTSLFAAQHNPYRPYYFRTHRPSPPSQPQEIDEQLSQQQLLEQRGLPQDLMTGDWGGGRTYLREHGVIINLSYVTDSLGNPLGGRARGFSYAGSFGFGLSVDFEKACGWSGFEFFNSVVWRTGTSLSRKKIDNQFPVQQVFGSQTIKLNELFFKQSVLDDRLSLKAGRLNAGNDYLVSPLYGEFVNNAFDGNPISLFFNFPSFTAYPNATWGATLAALPLDEWSIKFGVYNANTDISLNKYHGANFTFESTDGVIWITEWAALVNSQPGDTGLPGHYKVGFFYQTGAVEKFENGAAVHNGCLYFLFDQMLYRAQEKTHRGLTAFISLLFTPKDRNPFPFFCTGGLVYEGLFKSRPKDSTNLGFAYGRYSTDLAAAERAAGAQPQSFEAILEFNHWFQINDWFLFTPDVQYIINPKGFGTIQNALVLGAQISILL